MFSADPDQQGAVARFVQPLARVRAGSVGVGETAWGLTRLRRVGLAVPPGFVVKSQAAEAWRLGAGLPDALVDEVAFEILHLQVDSHVPQLLAIRASAHAEPSLPFPSFVNVGLDRATAESLGDTAEAKVAWQRYGRLLQRWALAIEDVPASEIEAVLAGSTGDARRRATALEALLHARGAGLPPGDLVAWVCAAAVAIWRVWEAHSDGADAQPPPAVVVQRMVFGDEPGGSGVGRVVSRDPATGSPQVTGGFVHAGPALAGETGGTSSGGGLDVLAQVAPAAHEELHEALPLLEAELHDACEVAFAVDRGRLWALTLRPAARNAAAAVRIAVDLVDEGLITTEEALLRLPLGALQELQEPVLAREEPPEVLAVGEPLSAGHAVGAVVFDSEAAQELAAAGRPVVLVCESLSLITPLAALAAQAVVCRDPHRDAMAAFGAGSQGHAIVVGASELTIERERGRVTIAGKRPLLEGDVVSVDGARGLLSRGAVRHVPALPDPRLARFLDWCAERQALPVLTRSELAVRLPDVLLVEPEWPDVNLRYLRQAVELAAQGRPRGLALALPAMPSGGDLSLPAGPWRAVVADPSRSWAAALLAARLPVRRPLKQRA